MFSDQSSDQVTWILDRRTLITIYIQGVQQNWQHFDFRTSQNPFDPSGPLGLLMAPYKPFNPSVAFRTHQPHMNPLDPSGPPQDQLRTTAGPEYPLSTLGTPQNPSSPIRTPQDPILRIYQLVKR